jgi:hypothetical protein
LIKQLEEAEREQNKQMPKKQKPNQAIIYAHIQVLLVFFFTIRYPLCFFFGRT